MYKNKLKHFTVWLVVAQLIFAPGLVAAQIGDVPVSDSALGTGGILGKGLASAANGLLQVVDEANNICTEAAKQYFRGDKSVSFGLGGLSLISGGSAVVGQLTTKINAIDGFIICHKTTLGRAKNISAPNTFSAQRKQLLIDEITKQIADLEAKREPILNQLKVAQQGFWKTLTYNILIKTTKTIAINMVNKLAQTFKINDYKKYADAVATQVYNNQYILDNFSGSRADQMLARSMLSNPILQEKLSPAVFQRADLALGFDPQQMDMNDPNYYQKMFYVGSGGTNPFMTQASFADAVQAVHYRSQVVSQAEIVQSGGLKTPRDCRGTMAQQIAIDQQYQAVNKRIEDRAALLKSLNDSKTLGYAVSDSDLARAQNDYVNAQKEWQALPNNGNPVLVSVCEGIVSPPSLISKGIDQAFNALGQNIGTYNENNLPFFINFISDVANSVTNQMIFAGGISGSRLLNENIGNLTQAASILATGIPASGQIKQSKNLVVSSTRTDDGSKKNSSTFEISWDANGVENVQFGVAISGPNLPPSMNGVINSGMTGAITINLPVPGDYVYTVTAYGKSKADVLATVSYDLHPREIAPTSVVPANPSTACNGQYPDPAACLVENPSGYCDTICGPQAYLGSSVAHSTELGATPSGVEVVAGAYTSAVPLSPRGPSR